MYVSILIYAEFTVILTEISIVFLKIQVSSGNVDNFLCGRAKLHVRISAIDF